MRVMPTECACFEQPEGTAFTWCNFVGLCLGLSCFGLPCCYCRVSEEEKKRLPEWFKTRKGKKFSLCTCLLMFCVSPFLGVPWCIGVEGGWKSESEDEVHLLAYEVNAVPDVLNSMR